MRVRSGINRDLLWIVGSSNHGCWLGHYEQDKQDAIERYFEPGMRFFDIGANAGFYTLAAARRVTPAGHVWAFEPYAENVCNLLRHVDMNEIDNVTVVQAAVSTHTKLAGFSIAESNAMGHVSTDSKYLVPTLCIDEFCRTRAIEAPSLMKIDVEGAELDVLEGAREALGKQSTVIFLSLHGPKEERGCIAFLEQLGYRLVYLDGKVAHDRPLRSDEIVALPPSYEPRGLFKTL